MEELDIPATLAKLETYGKVCQLSPIERVLAGHTGTVVLLLSLYFNKLVEVVVVEQEETPALQDELGPRSIGPDASAYSEGVIHRRVELVAGRQVVARASTVIPSSILPGQRIGSNSVRVLKEVRRREMGIGHIAVKLGIPTQRTIICVEATAEELSRTYVMQGRGLYYTITETFPRKLYGHSETR